MFVYLLNEPAKTTDVPVSSQSIKANLAIVEAIKKIAERKGVSPAQLSIAWVASLGPHVVPLPSGS